MIHLRLIKPEQTFSCKVCGETSHGPFKIAGQDVNPSCQNDDCHEQWWHSPLFETVKSVVRLHDDSLICKREYEAADVFRVQAPSMVRK